MTIGFCRKGARLGLMSMSNCERNRADKGGTNVRELVIHSLKDRHREDGEQDTGAYEAVQ